MGVFLGYKTSMVSFIISLLVVALTALPVWAVSDPNEALVTVIVLTLILWPLLALAMRVVDVIVAVLGEAVRILRVRE